MIDPILNLSLFAKRTKDARVKPSQPASVLGTSNASLMAEVLFSYIEDMRDKNSPRFMGFTSYVKNHIKDHIIECSAVTLEYPYSKKAELEQRLAELNYPHYQIDTQADFSSNRGAEAALRGCWMKG